MKDDTLIVTNNHQNLLHHAPDFILTFPLAFLHSCLGDPLLTLSMGPHRQKSRATESAEGEEKAYVPRTELGRRLWGIRKRIVAEGKADLDWSDIEREIADRRGAAEDRLP